MPGFDGTGPRGQGPMTGGGRGRCNPYGAGRGRGRGQRGAGRGGPPYGGGRGRVWGGGQAAFNDAAEEGAYIREEIEAMEQEIDFLKKRLAELENSSSNAKK